DRDRADPPQRDIVEVPPVAPGRLFDVVGSGVGYGAATADDLHLIEKILFLHGTRRRVDRRGLLLRRDRRGHRDRQHQRQRTDDQLSVRGKCSLALSPPSSCWGCGWCPTPNCLP